MGGSASVSRGSFLGRDRKVPPFLFLRRFSEHQQARRTHDLESDERPVDVPCVRLVASSALEDL